ncbi:MAG: hypothetical protein K1060chlam5_00287 [Candidatus Anoxychlamydiales bacterium]|nr:hypothetical protein [Candidatus Anoxychlamydiales bacterium]
MNIKNKILVYVVTLKILILLIFLGYIRTDGFSLRLIQKPLVFSNKKTENIDEISSILDQNFKYLARGRQSFVFVSDDDKYVIKFLNSRRYDVELLKNNVFNSKYIKKHYERRKKRFLEDCRALDLAFDNFRDEAALVYVHPYRTNCFNKTLNFFDKLNRKNSVDLDEVVFILQKKANFIFYEALDKAEDSLKDHLIKDYLNVIEKRAKALVIDSDLDRRHSNYAVLNNKVITIDVGRTYLDEKLKEPYFFKKEIIRSTKSLRRYLMKRYPEKLVVLLNESEKIIKDFENTYLDKKYFSNHFDASIATSSSE